MKDFPPHDHFYLLTWARDLKYRFPFIDEDEVDHPYELFFLIWKLSWLFGRQHAHYSVCLERLVQDPVPEIRRLLAAVGESAVDPSQLQTLIVDRSREKWRRYASDDWFKEREARAESALRRWSEAAAPRSLARE
jgi:hypothetical protein